MFGESALEITRYVSNIGINYKRIESDYSNRDLMKKYELTQKTLKQYLFLDEILKEFIWIKKTSKFSNIKIGQIAGYIDIEGYRNIKLHKNIYKAHQLVVLYEKGYLPEYPEFEIDHINGNKSDNRMDNLRVVTQRENCFNRSINSNNTSGYKGSYYKPRSKNWNSSTMADKKYYYLGTFNTKEEAAKAYDIAAIELFGEFANTNFPKENYK